MPPHGKSRQLALPLPALLSRGPVHGGRLSVGRRKTARPFDPARSIHVTLRSERARDGLSLLHPCRAHAIRRIVYRAARRHGVQVLKFVNVGNHLHLHLLTKSGRMALARPGFQAFLREAGGLIARAVTGAKKGAPARRAASGRAFWDHLAWSRVLGRARAEALTLTRYLRKNERDAAFVVADQNWPEQCLAFTDPGG